MKLQPSLVIQARPFALILLLGGSACQAEPVHDLGFTSGDVSASNPESASPLPPVAERATDFVGVWIGSADDPLALASNADHAPPPFRFQSGSTRIRLELSAIEGQVFPAGSLTFGEAAPPPPATDPNVGYPVEPDLSLPYPTQDSSARPATEGVVYRVGPRTPARDVAAAGIDFLADFFEQGPAIDGKLDLTFYPNQVFESWCALQTATTCPSNVAWASDDDGNCFGPNSTPIDCLKLTQCASEVCACPEDDSACSMSILHSANLTIRFSDDGVVGLSSGFFLNERGFQQPIGTVRFQRETSGSVQD